MPLLTKRGYWSSTAMAVVVAAAEEGFVGVLDTYPGATGAWSFRRLSGSYSGSAVRIRRDSDDVEADIGFDANGDFDVAAAAAHIGGSTGYVTTWYDQSGNSRNLTNATEADQPTYEATGFAGGPCVLFPDGGDGTTLFSTATIGDFFNADTFQTFNVMSFADNPNLDTVWYDANSSGQRQGHERCHNGFGTLDLIVDSSGTDGNAFGGAVAMGIEYSIETRLIGGDLTITLDGSDTNTDSGTGDLSATGLSQRFLLGGQTRVVECVVYDADVGP